MDLADVVNTLEDAASRATCWLDLYSSLRDRLERGSPEGEHLNEDYALPFAYWYVEDGTDDHFLKYGPFAPWVEAQQGTFPMPLRGIEDQVLKEWALVLGKTEDPVLVSRLADLLWVRRWGERPDLLAREAIDAYLTLSQGEWISLTRAVCLMRASTLCTEIGDREREELVTQQIIGNCREEFSSTVPQPGVSLGLIEALLKLPKSEIPSEVDDLLASALRVHGNDAFIANEILRLMSKRTGPGEQRQLRLEQVARWEEEADKSDSYFQKSLSLQKALEIARNHGLKEKVSELRAKLQVLSSGDELKTITVEAQVPAARIERFLNTFTVLEGWTQALQKFGAYGPPSGIRSENIEAIEKMVSDHPLQFFATRLVVDKNDLPVVYGATVEDNKAIALVQQESLGIEVFRLFAPEILERMKKAYGEPDTDELAKFFTSPLITNDEATNIAEAIHWYCRQEYDACGRLLIPTSESILRGVARELGLVVFGEPVGARPGRVRGLGEILEDLKGRVDESWRRYYCNLLTDQIGKNLRNDVSHGLLLDIPKGDAALLIHLVCNLCLLEIRPIGVS